MGCKECGNLKHYAKGLCRSCWKRQRYHANTEKAKAQAHKWKAQHKEHIKQYTKQYWEKNKHSINEQRRSNPLIRIKRKEYYYKNRIQEIKKKHEYDLKNRDLINAKANIAYWKNPEQMRKKSRRWAKLNKQRAIEKNKRYYHAHYKNNELFKLQRSIRKALWKTLKSKNVKKDFSTFDELGYDSKQLKEHLEKQFAPEMNWQNFGKYWNIDHIIPISWAKTKQEVIQLNALENLQPLEAKLNFKKNNHYSGKPPNNTI